MKINTHTSVFILSCKTKQIYIFIFHLCLNVKFYFINVQLFSKIWLMWFALVALFSSYTWFTRFIHLFITLPAMLSWHGPRVGELSVTQRLFEQESDWGHFHHVFKYILLIWSQVFGFQQFCLTFSLCVTYCLIYIKFIVFSDGHLFKLSHVLLYNFSTTNM